MINRYKFILLLFVTIYLISSPVTLIAGKVYKWIDKKGTVYFTDNYLSIPPEYRHQIKIQKAEETFEKKSEGIAKESLIKKSVNEERKAISDGERAFNDKCTKCHSLSGKNPDDSATQLVGLLYSDKFKESTLPISEDSVKRIIKEGGGEDMPSFPEMTDKELNELMRYLISYMKKR